jgi:coproporphyrinogen III oxidase-like Fe-S oxidoreductase
MSENTESTLITPQENEMSVLSHSIIEWRRLKDNSQQLRQQVRENNKKMKALEEVIMRVMKTNNIAVLDLPKSGSRLLYKKQKRQAGLNQKNLVKLLTDGLQSEEKANDLIKYIQEHREFLTKESIVYEKSSD